MNNEESGCVQVLDKGFVRLVTYDASDEGICDAARVSYQKGTKKVRQDRDLIRYLLRHEHGTPFEMNFFQFHVKAPIFVFRQWHRHRVGISINEMSGRYSQFDEDWYVPAPARIQQQSANNKQGSGDALTPERQRLICEYMDSNAQDEFALYNNLLQSDNLAREIARINLPVSTYSQMYWACNLRSLFHFLRLRLHSHAQYEIRQYANAMYELIKPIVPLACEAFEDYVLNAVTFSRQEMEALMGHCVVNDCMLNEEIHCNPNIKLSKRELNEFARKLNMPEEYLKKDRYGKKSEK